MDSTVRPRIAAIFAPPRSHLIQNWQIIQCATLRCSHLFMTEPCSIEERRSAYQPKQLSNDNEVILLVAYKMALI